MKKCTRCNNEYPATLEHFYANPKGIDKLGTRCKTCCKLQIKERWESNPEYFIEHSARKRALDREGENRRVKEVKKRSKAKGTACVYMIENTITGKIYIGETTWKHQRWISHKSQLVSGKHENPNMQKDFDEHGIEAFVFSIVKAIESKDKAELLEEETKAIKLFLKEGKTLYNIHKKHLTEYT